jgi:hypothetical protein
MHTRAVRLTLAIGALAVIVPHRARPQASPSAVLRVHVTDTSRVPLGDVDLTVVKNGTEMVLIGRTDAAGRYTLRFAPDSGRYRLVVRRVGYVQTTRLLTVTPRETLTVELTLARLPTALDTVRAEAPRRALAKQPFVGAEEIERDTRGIFDLADIIKKLRPDINYQDFGGARCPSSGSPPPSGRGHVTQPPIRVYANGKWIFPMPDFNPMKEIRSEHILELHFVTCLDRSIPGLPAKSWASIYLTLKPGVVVDLKHGSYVADSAEFVASEKERLAGVKQP